MRYKDTRVIAIYFAARIIWGVIQISPRYSDILDIAIGKVGTHSIVITSLACTRIAVADEEMSNAPNT